MSLDDRVALLETDVVKKDSLHTRWPYASADEIADLCEMGKLRAYQHHKGPINGVIYGLPTKTLYNCAYFLLDDVARCEKEYPDFEGRISSDDVPVQSDLPESPEAKERIAGLEARIADLAERLGEARRQIEEKEAAIAEMEKRLTSETFHQNKGLAAKVCAMRNSGATDEAIAEYLYADGEWCSYAQIGALLHSDATSRVAADSMQQRARRLLGKA